jgi:hypothetical protein
MMVVCVTIRCYRFGRIAAVLIIGHLLAGVLASCIIIIGGGGGIIVKGNVIIRIEC